MSDRRAKETNTTAQLPCVACRDSCVRGLLWEGGHGIWHDTHQRACCHTSIFTQWSRLVASLVTRREDAAGYGLLDWPGGAFRTRHLEK